MPSEVGRRTGKHRGAEVGKSRLQLCIGKTAPLIATALLAATGSGYMIALYILFCAVVSIVAASLMPDYTNKDISQEHDRP